MAKKNFSGLVTVILVCGLLFGITLIDRVYAASSISKPSIPEFTVKFVNASYPVTTTNPYTGLSETTLVSNNSIQVSIKKQPFSDSNYQIYYNLRLKPRYDDTWKEAYSVQNWTSKYNGDDTFSYAEYIDNNSPPQSTSSYIIVTFPVVETDLYSATGYDIQRYYHYEGADQNYFSFLSAVPFGGEIDFQVEALVGHASQRWVIDHPLFPTYGGHFEPAIAYDTRSGWSNTQNVAIGARAPSLLPDDSPPPTSTPDQTTEPSPSQTTEPAANDASQALLLGIVIGTVVTLVLVIVGLLIYFKRRGHQTIPSSPVPSNG